MLFSRVVCKVQLTRPRKKIEQRCSWANWQTGKQLFVGKMTKPNARENTERRVGLAYWRSATTAQEYVFTMYQRDQDKPGSLDKKNVTIETCI